MDKINNINKVDKVDKVEKKGKGVPKVQNNQSKRKIMEAYYRPETGSRYDVLRTMYVEE